MGPRRRRRRRREDEEEEQGEEGEEEEEEDETLTTCQSEHRAQQQGSRSGQHDQTPSIPRFILVNGAHVRKGLATEVPPQPAPPATTVPARVWYSIAEKMTFALSR